MLLKKNNNKYITKEIFNINIQNISYSIYILYIQLGGGGGERIIIKKPKQSAVHKLMM